MAKEGERLQELAKKIFKAEHEADVIKDEIRRSIPKRFFLPVYRGDLLGYLKLQDDMADTVEDLAVLLTLKNIALPSALHDEVFAFVDKVLEVCRKTKEIAEFLPTLVDAVDGGPGSGPGGGDGRPHGTSRVGSGSGCSTPCRSICSP